MSILRMSSRAEWRRRSYGDRSAEGVLAQIHQVRVEPRTVLAMDLLLQERKVDLNAVTEVLSSDPGAMMCVVGMLAEDCSDSSPLSVRIVDWIAQLDLNALLFELAAHMRLQKDALELKSAMSEA